jgi:hypothetical protein
MGGYEAKKKQIEEEKKKKQEEEEKKLLGGKKVDPEKAKTERKEFMKLQKEKLKDSFMQIIKQREDLA